MSDAGKHIKEEYAHMSYPEDVKEHKEYRQFEEVFQKYSPVIHMEPAEEYEDEDDYDN